MVSREIWGRQDTQRVVGAWQCRREKGRRAFRGFLCLQILVWLLGQFMCLTQRPGKEMGGLCSPLQKPQIPQGFQLSIFKSQIKGGHRVCDQIVHSSLIGRWWGKRRCYGVNIIGPWAQEAWGSVLTLKIIKQLTSPDLEGEGFSHL